MTKYVPVTQDKRKKLSDERIFEMREAVKAGETIRDVARQYGISAGHLSRIINGFARKIDN